MGDLTKGCAQAGDLGDSEGVRTEGMNFMAVAGRLVDLFHLLVVRVKAFKIGHSP